jgi:hypothetical protein
MRSGFAALTALAGLFLTLAVGIVAMTYAASPMAVLHDVASVARMPIPGSGDAKLDARSYGLYFGLLNAPTRKAMRVPKLRIRIVPPKGAGDPEFVQVPPAVDVLVDRFHTVQVATITVRAPGLYHVHVESPEESGGSFSIGEPPEMRNFDYGLVHASPFIVLFLVLSLVMMRAALIARRKRLPGTGRH